MLPTVGPGGDGRTTTQANPDPSGTAAAIRVAATRFAHYSLIRHPDGSVHELGRGAVGVTFLARDTVLDCLVALKIIDPHLSTTHPEIRARFLREARAAASLRHPNVAGVFHYGEETGQCFYAMEFVEGETLAAKVRREGPLPVALALEVARQVAHALVAAEAHGIVHRDLKPSNLMIAAELNGDEDGEKGGIMVKVIDFGLARAITAAGVAQAVDLTCGGFVGTPAFASPEQIAAGDEPIDTRSDLYSLGVTLWYLLTGKVPFAGRSLSEIHDGQARGSLPLKQLHEARVPDPVVTLLRGLLANQPSARPQSARQFAGQLRRCREQLATPGAAPPPGPPPPLGRGRHLRPVLAAATLALAVAATGIFGLGWWPRAAAPGPTPSAVNVVPPADLAPERSVAVLPFLNLSEDKNDSYFAVGVQEEILTSLARIADLKVISRISALSYQEATKRVNLREVARELGVTHIVEGSVRRIGNQVRVNARLVDARTATQRWAERYDRPLDDIFAIQSEIAEQVTAGLRSKLSPDEKAALDTRPTRDLAAYELYLRAKELVVGYQETADWRDTLLRAVRLLDEATRRDPEFALAWCLAATAHDHLLSSGLDPSPVRRTLQETAVNTALRVQPGLGEGHLARARLLYRGKDYDGARRELAIAHTALPNSAEVFSLAFYLDRRQGRWPEALQNQEKAFSLDPRNPSVISDRTVLYDALRMYPQEIEAAEAAIQVLPGSADYYRLVKATTLLCAGQVAAAQAQLDALPASHDPNGSATSARVSAALYVGDTQKAAQALASFQGDVYPGFNAVLTPRAWLEATVARAAGDTEVMRSALTRARVTVEADVRQRPEDSSALALLGQIDAGLGRKEEALRAGRRAVEMRPVAVDALDGPGLEIALALICAWTGETDEAMRHLLALAKTPGGPDYGQLRYDPAWASLRGRADYQAMLTQLESRVGL